MLCVYIYKKKPGENLMLLEVRTVTCRTSYSHGEVCIWIYKITIGTVIWRYRNIRNSYLGFN